MYQVLVSVAQTDRAACPWRHDHVTSPEKKWLTHRTVQRPTNLICKSKRLLFSDTLSFTTFHIQSKSKIFLPSWLVQRGKTPPNECPVMTLNSLMLRFQQCWSFGECGVPFQCHHSQVNGLNRTNSILMLTWIVWLNLIVWNRNVFDN